MTTIDVRPLEPTVSIVDLTPALAQELYETRPPNRKIDRSTVDRYKRVLRRGEWSLNGESIKRDVGGRIHDGQHRCLAVIETGITMRTFMVDGVAPDAIDTMDTGKHRSLHDELTRREIPNAVQVGALTRRLLRREESGLQAACAPASWLRKGYSLHEYLMWFDQHRWVQDYVAPAQAVSRAGFHYAQSILGVLIHEFEQIDRDDSQFFWARVGDGADLGVQHPIYLLRRSFERAEMSSRSRGGFTSQYAAALIIKAWNLYRDGLDAKLLIWRGGGVVQEKFPEPH